MKNKKGFISISIIYTFLILFILIMFSIIISYSNRANMISSIVEEAKESLKEINNKG